MDGIDFYQSRSSLLPFHDDRVAFLRVITQTLLASSAAAPGFVNSYQGYGSRLNLKVLFTTAAGTVFDRFIVNRIALVEDEMNSEVLEEDCVEDVF